MGANIGEARFDLMPHDADYYRARAIEERGRAEAADRVYQDMLERVGFRDFSFARSEDAAVFGATERPIDLITVDVRLLPGDGLKAVEAICTRQQIPVIFVTGYAEELQDRAPNATVIQKPVKEGELAAAVRKVLDTNRPRD